MKRFLRSLPALALVCALLAGALLPASAQGTAEPGALTILFTHDTHDHFLPPPPREEGSTAAIPVWPPCSSRSGARRRVRW